MYRLKAVLRALFYCVVASTALRLLLVPVALCVLFIVPSTTHAEERAVGTYAVANCRSDSNGQSVSAFNDYYVNKGMRVRYACAPTGEGLRGVVTQNIPRKARVKAGMKAEVSIVAPPGTEMLEFTWEARVRRVDCRYAMQTMAMIPGSKPIMLFNQKANRSCAGLGRAQIAQATEKKRSIPGAIEIKQRVQCIGKGKQNWCSGKSANFIRTLQAVVLLKDVQAPSVQILGDTPLAGGAWVRGDQPLSYTASDNIGIERAQAVIGGDAQRPHPRPCLVTAPGGDFTALQPCPNGPGQIVVSTSSLTEGTQQLVVQAEDAASNTAASEPLVARIDNTAPVRVDVALEGGDHWRNQNAWTAVWDNPDEGDRAPIVAADFRLCEALDANSCSRDTQAAPGISRLPLTVPGPGEWKLSVWRTDAAGNQHEAHRSVPVTLRYDPEPPKLAFESLDTADPTLVAARATDELSGVSGGVIEIAPAGTASWQPLPTGHDDGRLVARIDDATLSPGLYLIRAHTTDRAGNQTTQDRRSDGQLAAVTLPLRKPASIKAGFERTVRRPGTRRGTTIVLRPAARVGFEQRAAIAGRLRTSDGRAIAGAAVQLFAAEQVLDAVTTDANGRFRTSVIGNQSQNLRLAYTGSSQALPTETTLKLRVPAATSAKVSRSRVRNGQAVTFRGRVHGLPVPAAGKLVEIQVRFTDRWQTFRTTRSDALGRWSSRYRFQRTRGVQRYRFRIRLPKEAGYPFETSVSRTLSVQVSGTSSRR
jgi:hypothetical protein